MAADVADEVRSHAPLDEAPPSVAPLDTVLVATARELDAGFAGTTLGRDVGIFAPPMRWVNFAARLPVWRAL